jgi:diguanylate cyclase (GGDEF)-like protein
MVAEPERPHPQGSQSTATTTTTAALTRSFFSRPNRVAAFLWAAGALAVALVLPLRHWPEPSLLALVVPAAVAGTCAALRATVGERLPRRSLQVDVGLGNLLVSVVAAAAASEHTNLANLYLLVEVFAFLYLPLRSALCHLGAAGGAYAVVLGVGPRTAEPAVIAWLSVFGTAVVLGAVVVGLMSVLRSAAREDPLTGLANRRMWDERLDAELERAMRSGAALSVVVLDLDGFKAVNDAGGHEAGDRVLQDLARAWQAAVRGGGDLLARLGGDEFGLLAPGANEIEARHLARRLIEALPEGVSASVGVATWDRAEGASDLLRKADRVMYRNKRHRRRGTGPSPA